MPRHASWAVTLFLQEFPMIMQSLAFFFLLSILFFVLAYRS